MASFDEDVNCIWTIPIVFCVLLMSLCFPPAFVSVQYQLNRNTSVVWQMTDQNQTTQTTLSWRDNTGVRHGETSGLIFGSLDYSRSFFHSITLRVCSHTCTVGETVPSTPGAMGVANLWQSSTAERKKGILLLRT